MYDNIGRSIKIFAKVSFVIGLVASFILGIILMASPSLIGVGIGVFIGGPLGVWISSWFAYGFGELIDKTCEIARNTCGGERKSEAQSKVDAERISKIEKLRSQGLITEEEYQQAISKEQ